VGQNAGAEEFVYLERASSASRHELVREGWSMGVSWENILRLSIVHFMIYPSTQSGEGPILETVSRLADDDFFSVLEVTRVKDPAVRRQIRDLAESSHVSLTYGAQPVLLSQKLDLNSLDDTERRKAVGQVKSCIDESSELGAGRLALLSGSDPGEAGRSDATRALLDSLKEICAYGEQKNVAITIETFDREIEKRCLVGPAKETAALAKLIRKDYQDFGIMYDMAHAPLLNEDPRRALILLKNYLTHIHVGNCVKALGHPAYGDKHPRFGISGGEHDVEDLARFIKILFDVGYLGRMSRTKDALPIVGFEVRPLPGERPEDIIAGTKRVWRQAWARLQQRS
jgi:sugar phosphate isomerase/epimerase